MVHENNFKYLSAPTIEQIEAVVKAAGVCEYQFERYHNIYKGCIKKVRIGWDVMPAKHWHLFLEPTTNQVRTQVRNTPTKIIKQRTTPKSSKHLSSLLT